MKRFALLIFVALLLAGFVERESKTSAQDKRNSSEVSLGARLFSDERFSTPRGDLPASCNHCHLFDEDPQGLRGYTDFLARSWVSFRLQDPRRDELRNSPTLFDVARMPRLHFDGEFSSLEELVKGTLAGRPMGWLPGEEQQAFAQARSVILSDRGTDGQTAESYREQFKKIYSVEVEKLSSDETMNLIARAISEFLRTLNTKRVSPYDKFLQANNLEAEPAAGEAPAVYADRLLKQISLLAAGKRLKLSAEFDPEALKGFEIFLRTEGRESAGNCVACHTPPLFTDFSFHNTGISQTEYDRVHGEGSFAALAIPEAARAVRPSAQFRETPVRNRPGAADLGHWNFVDIKASPLRRAGESEDRVLNRMIATFKTPTLRNLAYTPPYMHTGGYGSLESALMEILRLSAMARAGRVRSADEELKKINITEADIAPLLAFLNTLNEDLRLYPSPQGRARRRLYNQTTRGNRGVDHVAGATP
ncbi:MAG: hypothetical protein L0229_05960 [Blastocatellia bacterium]|nr:hypothetical protein [Blastocatellia bacterium]